MTNEDKIVFFCDGTETEGIKKFCDQFNIVYEIFAYDYHSSSKIDNECRNYIHSQSDLDLIYLCEDDYLYFENSLVKIKEFLVKYPDYFCHPIDYPNLYESDQRFVYPSDIILTQTHHWRSIKTTTYTLAFTKQLFDKNYNTFKILEGYVWD